MMSSGDDMAAGLADTRAPIASSTLSLPSHSRPGTSCMHPTHPPYRPDPSTSFNTAFIAFLSTLGRPLTCVLCCAAVTQSRAVLHEECRMLGAEEKPHPQQLAHELLRLIWRQRIRAQLREAGHALGRRALLAPLLRGQACMRGHVMRRMGMCRHLLL